MRKSVAVTFAVLLGVVVLFPDAAVAQRRGRDDRGRREQRIEEVLRERWRIQGRHKERAGRGPAFCRSGAGHPVFGRAWCLDKGFGLGERRIDRRHDRWHDRRVEDQRRDRRFDDTDPVWGRVNWGDVRFRRSDELSDRELDESRLADVIGARNVARISEHAYELGATGQLVGVWRDRNPLTLRVQAGHIPVAELIDADRDRLVDTVRLAYYR